MFIRIIRDHKNFRQRLKQKTDVPNDTFYDFNPMIQKNFDHGIFDSRRLYVIMRIFNDENLIISWDQLCDRKHFQDWIHSTTTYRISSRTSSMVSSRTSKGAVQEPVSRTMVRPVLGSFYTLQMVRCQKNSTKKNVWSLLVNN